jgi:hypothetical protein
MMIVSSIQPYGVATIGCDFDKFDQRHGVYQTERYYRDGRYYQSWKLGLEERIYRGSNRRYYCRRSDGTKGFIIGILGGNRLESCGTLSLDVRYLQMNRIVIHDQP